MCAWCLRRNSTRHFSAAIPTTSPIPRYDLDITFFRIYENDKPVHLDHYLQWSKAGVKDGDLIFVSGHPGGTDRLKTMAQLQYLKNVDYPSRLANYKRRIAMFQKFSAESAENARIAQEDIFGYQNSQKAIKGEYEGLQDMAMMSQMDMAEREREKAYMDKHPGEPNPWQEISNAMKTNREIYDPLTYVERMRGFPADLAMYARQLWSVPRRKSRNRTATVCASIAIPPCPRWSRDCSARLRFTRILRPRLWPLPWPRCGKRWDPKIQR